MSFPLSRFQKWKKEEKQKLSLSLLFSAGSSSLSLSLSLSRFTSLSLSLSVSAEYSLLRPCARVLLLFLCVKKGERERERKVFRFSSLLLFWFRPLPFLLFSARFFFFKCAIFVLFLVKFYYIYFSQKSTKNSSLLTRFLPLATHDNTERTRAFCDHSKRKRERERRCFRRRFCAFVSFLCERERERESFWNAITVG